MRDWKYLPDLLLEQIFHYLSWQERLPVACTCKSWYQSFYNPCLWKTFVYHPPSYLEKYSQRIYYDIATINLSHCFEAVGHCFQNVIIAPTSNFFILNRSLNVIRDFYHRQQQFSTISDDGDRFWNPRKRLERFSFEFASQVENGVTYGTGGVLLENIRRLLDVLTGLKEARLWGLLLDESERRGVFDKFIDHNQDTLTELSLVDVGKTPLCEYGILRFRYLRRLELGVCELDADLLVNLVQETQLEELVLTQTRFTLFSVEFASMNGIPNHVWDLVISINVDLKVHQRHLFNGVSELSDLDSDSVIYQPHLAPVATFVFSSNSASLLHLTRLEQYRDSLIELVLIVTSETESSIARPIDEDLVQVVYSCPNLETLVLGGGLLSVHAATLLQLLLDRSKTIRNVFLEKSVVQHSFANMSADFFNSYVSGGLIAASSDPDLFVSAVRSQLQMPHWTLLSSNQFAKIVASRKYVS